MVYSINDTELALHIALVGLAFITCVLLVAGLPPLSGFVAKMAPGNQIDMAPTLLGTCVFVSTQALVPGSRGTLYAIDQATGEIIWTVDP